MSFCAFSSLPIMVPPPYLNHRHLASPQPPTNSLVLLQPQQSRQLPQPLPRLLPTDYLPLLTYQPPPPPQIITSPQTITAIRYKQTYATTELSLPNPKPPLHSIKLLHVQQQTRELKSQVNKFLDLFCLCPSAQWAHVFCTPPRSPCQNFV